MRRRTDFTTDRSQVLTQGRRESPRGRRRICSRSLSPSGAPCRAAGSGRAIVDEMRLALRGCRQGDGALLREPSRLGSRVLVGPDNRQKAIGVKAIHCVVSVLPAGTPNAINGVPCPFSSVLHSCVPSYCYLQGQLPYRSVSLAFFASWREKRSWRSGGAQRRAPKRDGSRLGSPTLRTTTFVQQLKR